MQKLIYGIFGLLALLVVVGFALPRTHQVEVAVEIDAHPATIFVLVNDFRRHELWSTWGNIDPNARILYSGSPRGEGALMTWDGVILGSGSQLITESRAYDYVGIVMNPGEDGEARSWYTLTPGVGTTLVTWGFEADYGMNIVGRYFASMLGGVIARDHYESLEQLKDLAESLPSANFSDIAAEHIVVEAVDIAYLPKTSRSDPAAIAEAMRDAYAQVLSFIDRNNLDD
ncbi:MAG: SRPBCC family protein, partial [Pseudomonadota bacterium]